MNIRGLFLIAKGVWLEAIRRKELYVIVTLCSLMIAGLAQINFFGLEELSKFYREIALKLMGISSALTVIVLASRQLPREFEKRTIYPLLARPIGRNTFVLGKLLGVLGAGAFCLALFMVIFVTGSLSLNAPVYAELLFQFALLQLMLQLVLASLCFAVSILVNLDAAITLGILFYIASSTFALMMTAVYETASGWAQNVIELITILLPQFMLFDLSEKAVHGSDWEPLSGSLLLQLFGYGLIYAVAYNMITLILFRRRSL